MRHRFFHRSILKDFSHVHTPLHVCAGLASLTPWLAPLLARSHSRLPLWPGEQLSPLGGRSIQSGGGGRLTCPAAQAQCERDESAPPARPRASVWCLCPPGLQIIVNVPAGSFHWRCSGQRQRQVTKTRRINQDWGVTRGRGRVRLRHQSGEHLLGNAQKCATVPVRTCICHGRGAGGGHTQNAASILEAGSSLAPAGVSVQTQSKMTDGPILPLKRRLVQFSQFLRAPVCLLSHVIIKHVFVWLRRNVETSAGVVSSEGSVFPSSPR